MWQCAVESAMDGSPSQPSRGTNCGNNGAINGPAGPPKVPQVVQGTAFSSHNWSRGIDYGSIGHSMTDHVTNLVYFDTQSQLKS